MGFTGWSSGCDRCRRTHTKCDGTRPGCQRCRNLGIECPGYRKNQGLIFKDSTKATLTRYGRKRSPRMPGSHSHPTQNLPTQVKLDPQHAAIEFFFLNYLYSNDRDWSLSRGLFDYLAPLYLDVSKSALLRPVVALLAMQSLSIFVGTSNQAAQIEAEVLILQELQIAMASPERQRSDETLLAVLAMDFVAGLRTSISGDESPDAHLDVVCALVKLRQDRQKDSQLSCALLAAARTTTLRRSLWSHEQKHVEHVVTFPIQPENTHNGPMVLLHDYLAQVYTLEWRMLSAGAASQPLPKRRLHFEKFASDIEALKLKVIAWYENVPTAWSKLAFAVRTRPTPLQLLAGGKVADRYVCYVLGQWHCILMWVHKLRYIAASDASIRQEALKDTFDLLQNLFVILEFLQLEDCGFSSQNIYTEVEPAPSPNARWPAVLKPSICQQNYALDIVQWLFGMLMEDLEHASGFDVGAEAIMKLLQHAAVARAAVPFCRPLDYSSIYY